jgi:FixJ family two-component response regulator
VIVVSGNTDDESVAEAMKAGAVDYIRKPFNLSDVVTTVERVLSQRLPDAVA